MSRRRNGPRFDGELARLPLRLSVLGAVGRQKQLAAKNPQGRAWWSDGIADAYHGTVERLAASDVIGPTARRLIEHPPRDDQMVVPILPGAIIARRAAHFRASGASGSSGPLDETGDVPDLDRAQRSGRS